MKIVMNKKEFIEKEREGVKANSWILQVKGSSAAVCEIDSNRKEVK